jgi:hypothetical protein
MARRKKPHEEKPSTNGHAKGPLPTSPAPEVPAIGATNRIDPEWNPDAAPRPSEVPAIEPAEVPTVEPPASDSAELLPGKFDAPAFLKLVVADVKLLRKQDIFRLLETCPPEHRQALVECVQNARPRLAHELNKVMLSLGDGTPAASEPAPVAIEHRPLYLPRSVASILPFAAKEAGRYAAMTGVRVCRFADKDGHYFKVEATDGKRAVILRGPCKMPAVDHDALINAPNGVHEALVEARELKRAFDLCIPRDFKSRSGATPPLGLELSEHQVVMAGPGGTITTNALEGRFPDIRQVLPKQGAKMGFRVNPHLLSELLLTASQFLDEAGMFVEVLFWEGEGEADPKGQPTCHPVGVIARNAEGITFDSLIMPIS